MGLSLIVSPSGFHSAIQGSKLVVIDFFATWCGPCKALGPKLEDLASKHSDVRFAKIDIDASGMEDVASSQNISAMPTLVCYKNGREVGRVVGADIGRIEAMVVKHK